MCSLTYFNLFKTIFNNRPKVFTIDNQVLKLIVVGIATVYGLDDQGVGVLVPVGPRIFSSPRRPDQL
jgi:hypothetical protein